MGFKLDFEAVEDRDVRVADGTYEVVVHRVNEDATPGGAEFMNFDFVIRNDIDQKFKNMHVWQRIFKDKTTGKYPMNWVSQIGKAAQLENGKEYGSLEDLMNDFIGKPLLVRVKNEKSTYQDKEYTNTNIKQWNKTAFPNVQHVAKEKPATDPFAGNNDTIEINENDLPF